MRDLFLDFEWPVAPAYEWQEWLNDRGRPVAPSARQTARLELAPATGPVVERVWGQLEQEHTRLAEQLGPLLNPLGADRPRHYAPLRQHTGLFRDFANLDHRDRAAILAFATEHGALGLLARKQTVAVRNKAGRVVRWHSAYGESYFEWAIEICYMREAIRLARPSPSFDDLRRLRWLCERHLRHVACRLSFGRTQEPGLVIQPASLISAMWLQLTSALTGSKRFVACKFCRRPIELSTDQTGSRIDREFCSIACKTKDYRQRKRTARRLVNNGASAREIARQIGTNPATVEAWVRAFRAQKPKEK